MKREKYTPTFMYKTAGPRHTHQEAIAVVPEGRGRAVHLSVDLGAHSQKLLTLRDLLGAGGKGPV